MIRSRSTTGQSLDRVRLPNNSTRTPPASPNQTSASETAWRPLGTMQNDLALSVFRVNAERGP